MRLALVSLAAAWLVAGCLTSPPVGDPGLDPGPIVLPDPDPDPILVPDLEPAPDPDPVPPADPDEKDPPPPVAHVVSIGPDAPVVLAGLEVHLVATVEPAYDGDLVWTSEAGDLTADGHEAVFRAPAAAGRYRVSASVPDQPDGVGVAKVTVPGGLDDMG